MKHNTFIQYVLISLTALLSTLAQADNLQKHPRVAELEDSLRAQASTYLRARFPDQPFLVSVSVDPLRRTTAKETQTESLPYFDTVSEEIQDEWDDPSLSLYQLQVRTTKITLQVSLSDTLTDSETSEIKDALTLNLHLIPARDEIRVEIRQWTTSTSGRNLQFAMAGGIALLFLMGLFFINRQSTKKQRSTEYGYMCESCQSPK